MNTPAFSITQSIVFIDVIINLNTGIYENGILTLNRSKILKNYFRDNIVTELLGTFALFLFYLIISTELSKSPLILYKIKVEG